LCDTDKTVQNCLPYCNETNDLQCCPVNDTCCENVIQPCEDWEKVSPSFCLGDDGWSCEKSIGTGYSGCQPHDGCSPPFFQCPDGSCALDLTGCTDLSVCASSTPYPCPYQKCSATVTGCEQVPPFWNRLDVTTKSSMLVNQFVSIGSKSQIYSGIYVSSPNSYRYTVTINTSPGESTYGAYNPIPEWSIYYHGVGGRSAYYDNIYSPVHYLTFSSTPFINNAAIYAYFKYNDLANLNINDLCIGYIEGSTRWKCANDPSFPSTKTFDTSYVGGVIPNNLFSADYRITFALIRKKWSPPTIDQIIADMKRTFDLQYWESILLTTIQKFSIVNTTIYFTFPGSVNEGLITNNTANKLFVLYGIPRSYLYFVFPSTKRTILQSSTLELTLTSIPIILTPEPQPPTVTPPSGGDVPPHIESGISTEELYLIIGVVCGSIILCIFIVATVFLCISCKRDTKVISHTTKDRMASVTSRSAAVSARRIPKHEDGHITTTGSSSARNARPFHYDRESNSVSHGFFLDPNLIADQQDNQFDSREDVELADVHTDSNNSTPGPPLVQGGSESGNPVVNTDTGSIANSRESDVETFPTTVQTAINRMSQRLSRGVNSLMGYDPNWNQM
jgi:hypothetical protein